MSLPRLTKTKFLGLLPLFLIVILGVALRVADSTDESLWLDETFSTMMSRYDMGQMFEATSNDNHPPLYYMFLKATTSLFGESALTIRLLSLLFGAGIIILTYIVGARLFSKSVGLVSAFFVALSPLLVWYSQEARSYAMLTFFALLSFWSLYEAVAMKKSRYWLIFILSAAVMLWTHYYAVFFIALEGIAFFAWWKKDWTLFRQGLVAGIGVLALYLPWIFVMWGKEGNKEALWWATTSEHTMGVTWLTFTGGYPNLWMSAPHAYTALELVGMTTAALILVLGVWVSVAKREWRQYVVIALFALVPWFLSYLLTNTWRPMYHVRFFLYSVPFLFLLIGYCLSNAGALLPKRHQSKPPLLLIAFSVGLGTLIVLLMSTTNAQLVNEIDKEDWNSAVPYLMEQARDQDIVVSDPPYHQIPLSYMLGQEQFRDQYFLVNADGKRIHFYGYLYFYGQRTSVQMEKLAHQSDRIWLVTGYGEDVPIKHWLDQYFDQVSLQEFKDIRIILYQKKPGVDYVQEEYTDDWRSH